MNEKKYHCANCPDGMVKVVMKQNPKGGGCSVSVSKCDKCNHPVELKDITKLQAVAIKKIMIRFNTENKTDLYWRLIIDGKEIPVRSISINVPTFTTQDDIGGGKVKFHITCLNPVDVTYENEGKDAVIN